MELGLAETSGVLECESEAVMRPFMRLSRKMTCGCSFSAVTTPSSRRSRP